MVWRGVVWGVVIAGSLAVSRSESVLATEHCPNPAGHLVSLQGAVELRPSATLDWSPARLNDAVCVGDTVRVGPLGRAALALVDESILRLDERTILRLRSVSEPEPSLLELLLGAVYFFARRPRTLEVETPYVNAAVRGTEFLVRVEDRRARVVVHEGEVVARNDAGELVLAAGEGAIAAAGEAPRSEVVVRPRDAVAWALHYPPVLLALADPEAAPRDLPPELREAVAAIGDNDHAGALAALDRVPDDRRDARYHAYRAGILLNVGQVDAAAAAIEQALAQDPDAADALAQRAVIAIARNEVEPALADARRAVEIDPDSSVARIALSYALQADFRLEDARAVVREAVRREPDDALAWERLAELELSLGDLQAAEQAAERAVALAPGLGRTQMVLGFASLARIDIEGAKADFERAVERDPASPLPRLGLGLARIREGDLEAGRREIEIAAGLDPGDALVRSYLGKAYFEERRDPLAGDQYELARRLDPNDPTPWFYDAIRKQLDNRPVEALGDLEQAIDRNDNRAVYRSRLLLDRDLATRSVSLARIYDDLGFDQRALVEASRSLSLDPGNHSAHRFLSDTYAQSPRHEIARSSELLRSQLLQPITRNPVQPALPYTDLNVAAAAGPAEAAFNEFTPLFQSTGAQVTASGVAGTHETLGDEVVVSALSERMAFSVGQFFSQTDGFRDNNDVENRLYDVFGQWSVTPQLDLQLEYRYRRTDQGDLDLDFDPDQFSADDRLDIRQDVARLGLHYAPAPRSDVLVSLITSGRDEDQTQITTFDTPVGPLITDTDIKGEDRGHQGEVQYIWRHGPVDVTAGAGAYRVDGSVETSRTLTLPDGTVLPPMPGLDEDFEDRQRNLYVYNDIDLPADVALTLGLGYDWFESDLTEIDKVTPKLGVQWQVAPALRLRAAYMRTVKRALVVEQTIEPTQVAGFNQFFDDSNGTTADRYGIGLDARLSRSLYAGVELSRRDLDVPVLQASPAGLEVVERDQNEDLLRTYLYWAPLPEWAFSAELRYERFESDPGIDIDVPTEVDTLSVPLFARYFSPRGWFGVLGATFVHQDVERDVASLLAEGDDRFVVVDAAIGYRLPARRGILSLEATNLLDKGFQFQGDNFRTSEPTLPRFVPERSVLARLTLNF